MSECFYENGHAIVQCVDCGEYRCIEMTEDQFIRLIKRKECVQNIIPECTPGEREMFITGICNECWDRMFEGCDDE